MNVAKVIKMKDDERVLRVVRNTWIIHLPAWAGAFVLVALPFFLMVPLFSRGWWGVALFGLSIAGGLYWAARVLFLWYRNAFIVTTERVVDIDQRGFFSRTVSEAPFDKIQDVAYSIKGIWGTLFAYGAIELQTAGTNANLELPDVRDPKDLHHLITESMTAHHARANGGPRNERVAALLGAAAELSDTEARAFLTAIQEAVAKDETKPLDEHDLDWLKRNVKEDPPADLLRRP